MKENGYKYVDLGLPSGTMWATCNVGADKPEDYGLLFQFGRVDGYKYGDENHKFKTNKQNLEDGSAREYIPITSSCKVYNKNENEIFFLKGHLFFAIYCKEIYKGEGTPMGSRK